MPILTDVELLRAGNQISKDGDNVPITKNTLQELQESFDPELHEVPIILGHSSDSDHIRKDSIPAFGWVKSVHVDGDHLMGDLEVSDELMEWLAKKFYKKRSIAYYNGDSLTNPHNQRNTAHRGKPTLRHLAMLGGHPPAIKGLADVAFTESEDVMTIEVPVEEKEKMTELQEERSTEDVAALLNENAEEWIVFMLTDGEDSFTGGISEIVPKPSKDNLWLFNLDKDAFEGQFRSVDDQLFNFEIALGADGTTRSFKPANPDEIPDLIDGEELTEAEDVMPEEEEELLQEPAKMHGKHKKTKTTEEIEEMGDGSIKTKKTVETQEFLEPARAKVSRPGDPGEPPGVMTSDKEDPVHTDTFNLQEEDPNAPETQDSNVPEEEAIEEPKGDGDHVHDDDNPDGLHSHDDLKRADETMQAQIDELQAQIQALTEEKDLALEAKEQAFSELEATKLTAEELAKVNDEMKAREMQAFVEGIYKNPEGAKLTEAIIPSAQLKDLLLAVEKQGKTEVITFGEGEKSVEKSPIETLKHILVNLPVMVEFGETAGETEEQATPIKVPAPVDGLTYDEDRLEEFSEMKAYAKKHSVSFAEAYKAVKELENNA